MRDVIVNVVAPVALVAGGALSLAGIGLVIYLTCRLHPVSAPGSRQEARTGEARTGKQA